MGIDETYNGWVNRETWAVALHLDNDQSIQSLMSDFAASCGDETQVLADAIKDFVEDAFDSVVEGADDVSEWAKLAIRDVGSMWRVEWRDVAEHVMDYYKESQS